MKLINKVAIILTVIFASSVFIFAAKNPSEEKEVTKEIASDFTVKLDLAF